MVEGWKSAASDCARQCLVVVVFVLDVVACSTTTVRRLTTRCW